MESISANHIARQFMDRILPACKSVSTSGPILNKKKQIVGINISAIPSDRKLLDALLLECSTPIKSSPTVLSRLYQNVVVQLRIEG
jgi:hypothetical protein